MAPAKPKKAGNGGLLHGARVYLSGPMDFVANREDEKTNGWRARIGNVLRDLGAIVFDPWNKPEVRGLHEYGKEGVDTDKDREKWTFENFTARLEKRPDADAEDAAYLGLLFIRDSLHSRPSTAATPSRL